MNYSTIDKAIGRSIREARESQGIRLTKLANDLGIAKQTLSYYETGQRSIPEEIFSRSCKVLKLNPHKILKEAVKQFVEEKKDSN